MAKGLKGSFFICVFIDKPQNTCKCLKESVGSLTIKMENFVMSCIVLVFFLLFSFRIVTLFNGRTNQIPIISVQTKMLNLCSRYSTLCQIHWCAASNEHWNFFFSSVNTTNLSPGCALTLFFRLFIVPPMCSTVKRLSLKSLYHPRRTVCCWVCQRHLFLFRDK